MHITINGMDYEVKEKSQKEIKEFLNKDRIYDEKENSDSLSTVYYGVTNHRENVILLDKDLPRERKKRTLIHELVHVYITNCITHEDKNYDEELVADIVANSYNIIKEIAESYFTISV